VNMLIDRIVNTRCFPESVNEELLRAQLILADNVYGYVNSFRQNYRASDFPCVRLPFERLFVEWNHNSTRDGAYRGRVGVLCTKRSLIKGANVLWLTYFVTRENEINLLAESVGYVLNNDYAPAKNDSDRMTGGFAANEEGQLCKRLLPREDFNKMYDSVPFEKMYLSLSLVPLMTLCFMNCRNVNLTTINPNKEGRKARHGKPLLSYRMLQIEPMKKIIREQGGHTDIKQALHIMRGHFKDYRDSKGLFGKHKGMYWWEQNLRGSAEHGKAYKDYNVSPL
jgi:hypothetical protein